MANKREKYSDTEHSKLYGETGGTCPLCIQPILFTKPGSKKPTRGYELAHIYPLNPTPAQSIALADFSEPSDINGLENLIALCPTCHTQYDKDFKLSELVKLQEIKNGFLSDANARLSISKYALQEEVYEILDGIIAYDFDEAGSAQIDLNLSTVDQKLKNGMSKLLVREIKRNAADFYVRIRDHIKHLEQQDQYGVRLLQSQIKSYYLAMQQRHPDNKDLVFNYISQWISQKSGRSIMASEILVAFFIQNCEVFDADSN